MATNSSEAQKIKYPDTPKDKVIDTYFGEKVKEPYRWLENDTSKATADWVKAQNKVTYNYLEKIPFRQALKQRLTNLYNYERTGIPFKKNGFYYFYENNGLQNQDVLFRKASLNGETEIILDPNTLSEDGTVALSDVSISKNGKYLAYSIARSGSDWNEIFIMNLENHQLLDDHIMWSKSTEIAWQNDGFYYSAFDAPEPGKEYSVKNEYQKIFYHTVGQKQSDDRIVYEDKKHPLRECYASVSDDEKYLYITVTETTSGNGLLIKDLSNPRSDYSELAPGFNNDYIVIGEYNDKVYILTNWMAPCYRLMVANPEKPARENWIDVLPESENVLEKVYIIGGQIIGVYMKDATNHLFIFDLTGKVQNEIQLPTPGTITSISGNKNDNEVFFSFTSYTFPPTTFLYNTEKKTCKLYEMPNVDFNPNDYVTAQLFYKSYDGTKIPMTITYKKGLEKNGKNPVLLYGYGGFNISIKPSFKVSRIPFLENGGIYAVANIRGGGEYGEEWHKAGTKFQKQNVFNDFIAAAEYLINENYTSSQKLAIDGGSNGGLLIGACMTQRPDLFKVAVPEVGVLDMLRYHKFTIGWSWTSDYGNSEESKEMFEYLKGYSPLHNIQKGVHYPATLIMTGDHDDRVVPAHSFKFAATLQAANKTDIPTLIRIDSKAGHGAGKPIRKLIDAETDMWSFVMYNLGMNPKF
ncbi:MAG: prolyl oligopeptidase family serine peptidase [Paludibacter sp.]|nr:prolyl oligopeptidase family serine peptidase [Paludibacter sp.]